MSDVSDSSEGLAYPDLYRAQKAGVLALVVQQHLVAPLVLEVARMVEVGVRVSAQDDVEPRSVCYEVGVHVRCIAKPEMAEADDEVAVLLAAQMVDDGLCCLGRSLIAHPLVVVLRDETLGLRADTEDAYAHARAFYYYIGFYESLARRAREVVVAADEWKLGHTDEAGQVLQAEVELMVPDGAGIIAHQVHELDLHVPAVEIVIDRPLAEVATVEQKHVVGVLAPHLFEQDHAPQVAALVGLDRVAEVGRYGFDAGMRVARMDQEQLMLLSKAYVKGEKGKNKKQYNVSHNR